MKSVLKFVLDFLERKFPDKAPFTPEDSERLKACYASLLLMEERVAKMEAEIKKFNFSLGFGNGVKAFQR